MAADVDAYPDRSTARDGTEEEGECIPSSSRFALGGVKRRERRMHYMGPGGLYYPWVTASPRRRGYLDTRRHRRDGPVCETCSKRHFPNQRCWSGPKNAKRDLVKLREERVQEKRMERARRQAADLHALVNARPPEVQGAPRREGARLIEPGSVRPWR